MSSSPHTAAAELLLAYRRRSPDLDLRTRELCRQLAGAVPFFAHDEQGHAGLEEVRRAVERAAQDDFGVEDLVRRLTGPPARAQPSTRSQNMVVTGSNNLSVMVGGNAHGPITLSHGKYGRGPEPFTRLLFVAADPLDSTRLRLGKEMREIRQRLALSPGRDRFALHERMSVRPADLTEALLDVKPHVVHFSGHGTPEGELCFEDEAGWTHLVGPAAIGALFKRFAGTVRCAVLNACYTEVLGKVLSEHVPYVVGMNQEIGDDAALTFTTGFYQALGVGEPFAEAYEFGCIQIQLQNIPEHLTPVLLVQSGTTTTT